MSECQFRRGFFLPHSCGNAATQFCSTCSLPLCALHQRFDGAQIHCPDCAGASQTTADQNQTQNENAAADPNDVDGNVDDLIRDRDRYRRADNRSSSSSSSDSGSGFTTDDSSSFDSDTSSDLNDDDSAPIDFGDS